MGVQNGYEIIGNQIKFYFKEDASQGWNQIAEPEFRTLEQIKEWCTSADNGIVCTWDALNQNAMGSTEATNFLYRWISWYIKTPADAVKEEILKIDTQNVFSNAANRLASDIAGGAYQAMEHALKQAAHMALDCIMLMCDIFELFI